MNKKFENFKLFLSQCSQELSMLCLTETWNSDESFQNNSNFVGEGFVIYFDY